MGILGTVTAVLQCGEYDAVVHRSAGGCSSSLVNYCSCNVAGVAGVMVLCDTSLLPAEHFYTSTVIWKLILQSAFNQSVSIFP